MIEVDRVAHHRPVTQRAPRAPGAVRQFRSHSTDRLRHYTGHSPRRTATHRADFVGNGSGRTLFAQTGAGRQGRYCFRRRTDGAADGRHDHLPAIVLPFLLSGVQVDPWAIVQSLILLMLIPLGIALFIRAQAPETAATYQPVMNNASSLAILILLVVGLGLNVSNMLSLIGTDGIIALLLFIIASFAIGFILGIRDPGIRSVMGLGTAQRNFSAALLVGAQNFTDPNVLTTLLVGAILLLLLLLPTARQLGSRAKAPAAGSVAEPAAGS